MLDQMRGLLRSPAMIAEVMPRTTQLDPDLDEAKITVALTQLDQVWEQLFPAEQARIVRLLVERVIVSPNDIEVRFRLNGIETMTKELIQIGTKTTTEDAA